MISKEEVKRIAKLARIDLTEKEAEKFQKELSAILDYFEKIKDADVPGAETSVRSVLMENIARSDEARSQTPEARRKIIDAMPENQNGYLKVKSIFNGID